MHYWQLHIGDWSKSCGHLTPSETGFYVRLLNVYYDTETPIPADLSAACRLVGARTPRERDEISGLMAEFFTLKDDGWHNKRADSEINRLHEIGQKRSNAAAKRWHTTSNANAMQLHTTSNALQDSKTPRLQDSKKDQDQEPAAEAPAKKTPAAKGERLSVDWSLPDDWKPDAIAAGVPVGAVDLEGRKFRDYWVAKTGKDATKMDWQATWRNWCRNAVARTYRPTQGKPSKHDLSQMNYSNGVTPDGKF